LFILLFAALTAAQPTGLEIALTMPVTSAVEDWRDCTADQARGMWAIDPRPAAQITAEALKICAGKEERFQEVWARIHPDTWKSDVGKVREGLTRQLTLYIEEFRKTRDLTGAPGASEKAADR
jgi:hypothetical protein